MKIICIGKNYLDHIKEMGNKETPSVPIIFMKPDTSIIKNNNPFYHPDFSNNIHFETEVIVRVCKEGKNVQEKFAHNYYDQFGLGIDFTARDIQNELKEKGLPWERAKSFNGAAPISQLIPIENQDIQNIDFSLKQNGNIVQNGNTSQMIFNIDQIISFISSFILLKVGDIIFTGTPSGVDKINIGDRLEGFIEDKKMLDFEVK